MDRGNFIEYILERQDVRPAWLEYTEHEFVKKMGNGTLPEESFKYYMIQDYLYLVRSCLARCNAWLMVDRYTLPEPMPWLGTRQNR